MSNGSPRPGWLLTSLLVVVVFAAPAHAADLWEQVSKEAWQKHGKKMATEYVRKQVKMQVARWLNDMKSKAPAEYHEQMNTLGQAVVSAQNLDAFVDAVVSGKPADLEKASADFATAFGKEVVALASKEKDRGAGLIKWMSYNSSKVGKISAAAGGASEGDFSKLAEFISGEVIEYVAPAAAPWVKVVQAAYGGMKLVRDVYTNSTFEALYQEYKKILDKDGAKAADDWVHSQFTKGGEDYYGLRTRMDEIRKAREEAFAKTGLKGDKMKELVSEEALIRNIIESMRGRREKEIAAEKNAENEREAERRARFALESLEYEMIRKHGQDWLNKVTFTPEMLDRYLTEVERLINEDGMTEYEAAGFAARRLAHGLNSDQVRDFIRQITEERKRSGRKPLILSTRFGTITQAKPLDGVKAIAPNTVLTAVAGNWDRKPDADPAKVYGPFEVPHGGKLKANITGDPPVPHEWSIYNSNSSMAISFEPKVGMTYGPAQPLLTLSGQTTNNKLSGEATWAGPGRITVVCGPARGSGPLSGCQFKQTYTGQVVVTEALPDTRPLSGRTLDPGDRLTLGGVFSETILQVGGSRVKAGNSADLTFKLRDTPFGGVPYLEQRGGYVRVVNPPGSGAPPLTTHLVLKGQTDPKTKAVGPAREYRVKPQGSDYEAVISEGNRAVVTVFHGAVVVTDGEGVGTWLNAGQAMQLPSGVVGETLLSRDRGCLLWDTLPIEQLPVDTTPQPYGTVEGRFDAGKLGGGWVWQDPGADVTVETPKAGSLKLTVPNGNDFWGNADQAPRVLHKATGDFDLSADVRVECKGRDNAIFDFLLFSPGSYSGYLAKQFIFDGHLPHYRKLGGWWMQQGVNKLGAYNRPSLHDRPDAPDGPVKFRLSRRGDEFTGYWSLDGKNWTLFLRETIALPDTIWVGGAFNRMAWDRLPNEKATFTLSGVKLVTAERGKLARPDWHFVQAEGTATAAGKTVRLALSPGRSGEVLASTPFAVGGDLDVSVKFTTTGLKRQAGESAIIQFTAESADEKNLAYVQLIQADRTSQRYCTDLKAGRWGFGYQQVPTKDTAGGMRLVRKGETWAAYYWADGKWVQLDKKFAAGFKDPVYLKVHIDNRYQAQKPLAFEAEFTFADLPVATSSQDRPTLGGKWSGPWTNSLGEKGVSTLKLSEDSAGKLRGIWDGIEVSGKRTDRNTIELQGKTKTRSYQVTGTITDGTMTLKYVATRLDADGSYDGQSTLTLDQ